ncbi:hypothetical protein D3C78_1994040 [compost metagenome]
MESKTSRLEVSKGAFDAGIIPAVSLTRHTYFHFLALQKGIVILVDIPEALVAVEQ